MIGGALFDDEKSADGQVNDGCSDVSHIGGIVDERADFAWRELSWRLILRGDRSETRVTALLPPQPEHESGDHQRQAERPIAAEKKECFRGGGGLFHRIFIEGDRDGQAFVIAKRDGGMDLDAVAHNFRFRFTSA